MERKLQLNEDMERYLFEFMKYPEEHEYGVNRVRRSEEEMNRFGRKTSEKVIKQWSKLTNGLGLSL